VGCPIHTPGTLAIPKPFPMRKAELARATGFLCDPSALALMQHRARNALASVDRASFSTTRVPEGVIAQPSAPRFASSQGVICECRWPRAFGGTAILMRTGKRRSAKVIISRGSSTDLEPPMITTQERGRTRKPFVSSLRLTISMRRCPLFPRTAIARWQNRRVNNALRLLRLSTHQWP
jgi:hypothetical protein